jgi:hypothetical protein
LRGESFLATQKPHALSGGGFHADAVDRQTKHVSCALTHALPVRPDLWAFAQQRNVDVDDARASGVGKLHRMAEKAF